MVLSKRRIGQWRRFAEKVAVGAGKILQSGFNRSLRIDYKGRINPVTEYDVKSERFITSQIRREFPDHAILAEEGSDFDEPSACRWVIDPLDGTVNYAHGFPVYCVSIALQYENNSVVGVVYDPQRQELFSAGSGVGVRLNGKKIRVSGESSLQRALLATGFAYDISTARRNNLGLFARMARLAQGVRRPGSAAIDLCWLAAGRLDSFWELHLHPWDTAAAILIVQEAGDSVSRINGKPYSIFDKDILASNGRLHAAMMSALTGKRQPR